MQKEVLAGPNAKPGPYVFALATHKGRLLLVLSCILGSGDTSKAGKRSMSQLRDRLLIESAERILGSTFVFMYGRACTCISMGVRAHVQYGCVCTCASMGMCTHVQVWVCTYMREHGCACPCARARVEIKCQPWDDIPCDEGCLKEIPH